MPMIGTATIKTIATGQRAFCDKTGDPERSTEQPPGNESTLTKINMFLSDLNVTLVTGSNFRLGVSDVCRGLIEVFEFPPFTGVENWNVHSCIVPHAGGIVALK